VKTLTGGEAGAAPLPLVSLTKSVRSPAREPVSAHSEDPR
jgi:hypothetical protein